MARCIAAHLALVLGLYLPPPLSRGGAPPSEIGQLVLSEPVIFINGPFTTQARTAKVGQTVLVQISYPIAPPFPKSVSVDSLNDGFSPVDIFRTDGELALLSPEPKRGRIGVGFLSVAAKAIKKGPTSLKVKIELADGTVKVVPIAFEIEDDR
jgi:hypothetical protein